MQQTPPNGTAEQHVGEIRRQTRKKYSAEKKVRASYWAFAAHYDAALR